MTKTNASAALIAKLSRAWDRAIRAEENAGTERQAWRLAAESDRALRRLQAARAGLPLPETRGPRNPRQTARDAFAALGTIGRSIARALTTAAALRKAQAANALRRAALATGRAMRSALRTAVRAIAKLALMQEAPRAAAPTAWSRTPSSVALALAVSPSSMLRGEVPGGPRRYTAAQDRARALGLRGAAVKENALLSTGFAELESERERAAAAGWVDVELEDDDEEPAAIAAAKEAA